MSLAMYDQNRAALELVAWRTRALRAENALAGLEPSDVATLVGLVRWYADRDSEAMLACKGASRCDCDGCVRASPLIARLPK
jgi:hypothetical protein